MGIAAVPFPVHRSTSFFQLLRSNPLYAVRSLFISPRTFSWLQTSATINGAAGDILTLLVCTRGQIRVRSASGSGITGAEKQCGHDCDGERPKTPCPIAPIADTPPPAPGGWFTWPLTPEGHRRPSALSLLRICRTLRGYTWEGVRVRPRETVPQTEMVLFCLALPLGDREPPVSPSSEVTGSVAAGCVISTEHSMSNPGCSLREERVLALRALSSRLSETVSGTVTPLCEGIGFPQDAAFFSFSLLSGGVSSPL